jgi:UDP-2-acetamido-2-deoxy-ribo-hexuluronate aminotransferase
MLDSIKAVLKHGQFIRGEEVTLFEQELAAYLGVKHVISCGNGTDALQLVYMALNLDGVIIPAFNYVSSAEAAELLGICVDFCDVHEDTYNINPDTIPNYIYGTKVDKVAIVATHLFGQQCDMDAVMHKAKKIHAVVIEDNAQSLGATWKGKHLTGLVGTTSFFPTKNLAGVGDGGAVYTNSDKLAKKIRKLANHGQYKKYYYDEVGINSRLDTIQAAVLRERLKELPEKIQKQQVRAYALAKEFYLPEGTHHTFNNFTIRIKNRAKFIKNTTRPYRIYYPMGIHQQKAYKTNISLPVTEQLCKEVISL